MSTIKLWKTPIGELLCNEMKLLLKSVGSYYSGNKDKLKNRLSNYRSVLAFPWREDQKKFMKNFLQFKHDRYVLQGVYGAGKTTMLMGCFVCGLIKGLFKPTEVMFVSYNISIKNELKSRLKKFGVSSKVMVRTFDSLIYEICKEAEYKYIKLPNFEGKRKFAYEKSFEDDFKYYPSFQPKVIIIDECQDLERNMLDILFRFYPDTKFVFTGDVFQSIQKEPRESLLWYFLNLPEEEKIFKMKMTVTPRVPGPILNRLQTSLKIYYPEFRDVIDSWRTDNKVSDADIKWKRFNSYKHIYSDLKEYLEDPLHRPDNTMILTFSSAITVRGAMGDIARIRRFMFENNLPVNTNHKRMDEDKYFLTTSNSSKGLEREYVIIFLTFPLERAFVHLSNDVVVNLISVALTRAKKEVLMYVPAFEDKYSQVLSIFETCPIPNKSKIREGKTLKEFSFQDYIDIEHSVTELIRASVIKYDTRILLTEHTKLYQKNKLFTEGVNHRLLPISTEEERCFVGVLIENLITSTWNNNWPSSPVSSVKDNPMYIHLIRRLTNSEKRYNAFIRTKSLSTHQFEGIMLYSQLHIAISNKIFFTLSDTMKSNLRQYWVKLKPKVFNIKPTETKLKIQAGVQMPWVTGIADAISSTDKEVRLHEIKASKNREWKEDALLQVLIYALMTGKSWSRLNLLNPFTNDHLVYYFDSKKILTLREEVLKDVLIYNTNAMMAKMYPMVRNKKLHKLSVEKLMFISVNRDDKGNINQVNLVNMLSPIKCMFLYNKYSTSGVKKDKKMSRTEKFQSESELSSEDLIRDINALLDKKLYRDHVVYGFEDLKELNRPILSIKEEFKLEKKEDMVEYLQYKKNKDLTYSLDFNSAFSYNIISLSYVFFNRLFV